MPFSEGLKHQVKRMAAFRCCRCHEVGVDIHHITPQSQGGTDDIDNAAPLCQNCHDRFGANPEKRKEIRQMRDFWYEVVKEKYYGDQSRFEKLNETMLQIQRGNQAEMDKFRRELLEEVRTIRAVQEQATAKLNYVPVTDIPNQVNTAIFGSTTVQGMGMPETLRQAAGKEEK